MSETATARTPRPDGETVPVPGPLGRLARLAYRRRGRTVLAWVAALVLASGLSAAFAGTFSADYTAPGSDSAPGPGPARPALPGPVRRHRLGRGAQRRPGHRRRDESQVEALLTELGEQPHVAARRRPVHDARLGLRRRAHGRSAPCTWT